MWSALVCAGLITTASSIRPAEAQTELWLGTEHISYLTPAVDSNQTNNYSYAKLRYQARWENRNWQLKSSFDLRAPLGERSIKAWHFVLPELYINWKARGSEGLQLSAGRRLFNWSLFDNDWSMGLWQPHWRWDYLSPKAMGLTALFAHQKTQYIKWVAFVSPLFLPDQGPHISTHKGNLVSPNRWYRPLSKRLQLGEAQHEVEYSLDTPRPTDVLFQDKALYGALLQIGNEEAGFWFQVAAAEKVQNQFGTAINSKHKLNIKDHLFRPAVSPVQLRHQIGSLELGYTAPRFKAYVSGTLENPIQALLENEDWENLSSLNELWFVGAGLSGSLPFPWWHSMQLGARYLLRHHPRESNALVEKPLDNLLGRFSFYHTLMFEAQTLWFQQSRARLSSRVRYFRSLQDHGEALSVHVQYQPGQHWQWGLGFDVLGAPTSPTSQNKTPSFFSYYRGNDRIRAEVRYVF